ncbi:Zip-domain-containing protein [Backusella circina FSU 941]|nr:Zip-domain-containing protein [Backusella circina FSU 941]
MLSISGSVEGWLMVLISSVACVMGAAVVFINKIGGKSLESNSFLSASMALGGGVLIFNSLYTLLPASQQKLESNLLTFICFFSGVSFTVFLTYLIQWCTPHAIHTCDPFSNDDDVKAINEVTLADEEGGDAQEEDLRKPLQPQYHHHGNHHHHDHSTHKHTHDLEYGTFEDPSSSTTLSEQNSLFLIGIQTAVAICIHKFPEGLIMFVSNESSSQLGLSVAAAMTIHNFIEGFLIALPLYYATASRLSAFGYASILGGMSQPLGAVLGLLAIRNVDDGQSNLLFGIIFGVVSGMMCLIAVQSMLPQAMKADTSHRLVPLFFFIGIFLVGLASLLQSI